MLDTRSELLDLSQATLELTHLIFCTLHNIFDVFFFIEEQAPNDPAIRFLCTFIVRLPISQYIVIPQPSLEFDKPWIPVSNRLTFPCFLCPLTRTAQFSQADIAFGNLASSRSFAKTSICCRNSACMQGWAR